MKKVLVVDPLSYNGHLNYNFGIIRNLQLYNEVNVIANVYHTEYLIGKGVIKDCIVYAYPNSWNITELSKRMNRLFYHIAFRFYFMFVLAKVKRIENKYDCIFLTSIDIFSFFLYSWFFKKKVFVVDHGIGNIKNSFLYRWSWKLTNKRVNIIVLEDFIKEMVDSVLKNNTYVVHHPLPPIVNKEKSVLDKTKKEGSPIQIFAPSASNDPLFLHTLCRAKIPSNLKIVAKCTTFDYYTSNLSIYNNYITQEEYYKMMNNADFIMLPYPSSYNHRTSAILFEALSMNKMVMILDNNTLSNYSSVFKGNVFVFNSAEDLFGKIKELSLGSFRACLDDYSDESISRRLKGIVDNICC